MGRTIVQDVQPSFNGGLNLTADPSQVQPNQVRDAENGRLSEYGGIGKRLGTWRITTAALGSGGPIQNGYTWNQTSSRTILAVQGGKLFTAPFVPPSLSATLVTNSSQEITTEAGVTLTTESPYSAFTDQGGTMSSTATPSFAAFLYSAPPDTECVYIADGGPLNRWNGTTLTENISSTPNVSFLRVYNQRLFGVSGANQSVYYSDLNNGNSLGDGANGGGEAIIRTFGDQRTTALAVSGSSLLIFHATGISKWTGFTQDDIAIGAGSQGVTSEVGTTAPFSVVEVAGNVFFLANNGFYVVSDNSAPQSISTPIDTLIRTWSDADMQDVRGVHVRQYQEVRWWIPNYGVLVYNYRLNAWSGPWTGGYLNPATTCLFESQDTNGKFVAMRGDELGWLTLSDPDGIYLDNLSTDATGGQEFTLSFQPHRFFANDYMAEKAYRWGYLLMDPRGTTDVTVTWNTQTGTGTYTIDPAALAASERVMERVPLANRGEWIDLTIEDSGEADALYSRVEIQGFSMGRRGGT